MKIFPLLFAALLCVCCQTSPSHFEVHHRGALHTMMHEGDLRATIALDTLQSLPHLYALGAVENLKGEVLIYDSQPLISAVKDGAVTIARDFEHKAALLVYAQINNWREIEINEELQDANALEAFVVKAAKARGLNVSEPFPFLIVGAAPRVDWHVIDWAEGDTLHTHERHKASGLHGRLEHQAVNLLGFYSDQHQGIFTHRGSNMHLHVKTAGGDFAAHVDEVELHGAMSLFLPQE